jgi:hypothetical protein
MPRSGPGTADRELISHLAARGLQVSAAQLERWRRASLLPAHPRGRPGRGRGSVSRLAPETTEVAAVLARHARQGRDLRLAVLGWFAETGLADAGVLDVTVPEPPEQAVLAALEHVTAASPWYRLFTQARAAKTETQQDDFYTAAADTAAALPATAERFDPATVRAALLTRQRPRPEVLAVRDSMVQLLAATGMGHAEVGADVLAEAISGSGLFPPVSAAACEQWLARLRQPEASSPLAELLVTGYDPVAMIRVASGEQLRIARKVALELAGFGSFCALHAALLRDTPGLAALRQTAADLGIDQMLISMSRWIKTTTGFATAVVCSLHPVYWAFHRVLCQQAEAGPPLLPDTEDGLRDYLAQWDAAIEAAS